MKNLSEWISWHRGAVMITLLAVAVLVINISLLCLGLKYLDHTRNAATFTSTESVYLICDVESVSYQSETADFAVVLPNKSVFHIHMPADGDYPEEVNEVIIETTDLDDYSTYNIVGMR